MRYNIQNNLGEVIMQDISGEELQTLKENALAEGFNYYIDDPDPDNNLVTRFAAQPDVCANCRIIVPIV